MDRLVIDCSYLDSKTLITINLKEKRGTHCVIMQSQKALRFKENFPHFQPKYSKSVEFLNHLYQRFFNHKAKQNAYSSSHWDCFQWLMHTGKAHLSIAKSVNLFNNYESHNFNNNNNNKSPKTIKTNKFGAFLM